ncbi:MAG TPA: SurA N-terminal domain-containing protein [Gaiellaceae bacterium]|nr:SurA N-terminal domain-containing protein [Gaiellaceae bacterium]
MNGHRGFLYGFTLVAISALALATGCGGNGGGTGALGSGVVATVAGDEITQAELDEVIAQAQDRLEAQGQKIPAAGSQEYQAFQQNALQYLVQRAQFDQQAEKLGVKVTEAEVDERVERVVTQFFGGSEEKYREALDKQNITDEQVRDELRATLVSEKIFDKVGDSAKVTDAEIKAYYESHPELYVQPPARKVRHILVDSKALADDIHAQLRAGGDFGALAKKHSKDSSKDVGGELTIRKGETVPQFEKVALALKVNEISKPVKTRFGWHVIEALGPLSAEKRTPLAQARKTIRDTLLGQERSDAVTKWLAELKREYEDKISYAAGFAPPDTSPATGTTETG